MSDSITKLFTQLIRAHNAPPMAPGQPRHSGCSPPGRKNPSPAPSWRGALAHPDGINEKQLTPTTNLSHEVKSNTCLSAKDSLVGEDHESS